jgi:hypothetical protein
LYKAAFSTATIRYESCFAMRRKPGGFPNDLGIAQLRFVTAPPESRHGEEDPLSFAAPRHQRAGGQFLVVAPPSDSKSRTVSREQKYRGSGFQLEANKATSTQKIDGAQRPEISGSQTCNRRRRKHTEQTISLEAFTLS